jgi:hypothetical protein
VLLDAAAGGPPENAKSDEHMTTIARATFGAPAAVGPFSLSHKTTEEVLGRYSNYVDQGERIVVVVWCLLVL